MFDFGNSDVDFALRLTRKVAILVESIQSSVAISAYIKKDLSPVTLADYAAQALTGIMLERERPEEKLIAEESVDGISGDERHKLLELMGEYLKDETQEINQEIILKGIERGNTELASSFWTLDPIDGTKGFLRGEQYAVAFARIEDGMVTTAALGCPNLSSGLQPDLDGDGVLVLAARGKGAWATNLHAESMNSEFWRRLEVSSQSELKRARILRSYEIGHTSDTGIKSFAAILGIKGKPIRMDSQAKQAILAAGGGEFLLRLLSPHAPTYKEKIWDQAAGSLIIEEAGGTITDLKGKPLDFTTGRRLVRNTGVIASNGILHEAALKALGHFNSRAGNVI